MSAHRESAEPRRWTLGRGMAVATAATLIAVAAGATVDDGRALPAAESADARLGVPELRPPRDFGPGTVAPDGHVRDGAPPLRPARQFALATASTYVAHGGARAGEGSVRRYAVEVEKRLSIDVQSFAREVDATLGDRRGWTAGEGLALRRVDSTPVDFRVILASPEKTDRLCAPLRTHGRVSCYRDGHAVINVLRWRDGAESYGDDLPGYRRYVINHEVGHALGHAEHRPCGAPGEPAPLMMQQTRGVAPCEPNPWPREEERTSVGG